MYLQYRLLNTFLFQLKQEFRPLVIPLGIVYTHKVGKNSVSATVNRKVKRVVKG